MPKKILLDTNLLVLFVVGGTSADYISKHKNCRSMFNKKDYDALLMFVSASAGLMTTPQILSETSNLLRQSSDPMKRELVGFLKLLIQNNNEIYIKASKCCDDQSYEIFGLNDISTLLALSKDLVLITKDGPLHSVACSRHLNVLHFEQVVASFSERRYL